MEHRVPYIQSRNISMKFKPAPTHRGTVEKEIADELTCTKLNNFNIKWRSWTYIYYTIFAKKNHYTIESERERLSINLRGLTYTLVSYINCVL